MNVLEKLRTSNELTAEDQETIVKLVNEMCVDRRVKITNDSKNKCYIAILCELKKKVDETEKDSYRLLAYSPKFNQKSKSLNVSDRKRINESFTECLENSKLNIEMVESLRRPSNPENQFVFVLGYALCLAMGQRVNTFAAGLKEDENTEVVRQVIANILQPGKLPTTNPENEIWYGGNAPIEE